MHKITYILISFICDDPQVAVPELLDAVKDADILIFVIPHQFVSRVCDTIKGHIKPDTVGMSLIKVTSVYRVYFSVV